MPSATSTSFRPSVRIQTFTMIFAKAHDARRKDIVRMYTQWLVREGRINEASTEVYEHLFEELISSGASSFTAALGTESLAIASGQKARS